MKSPLRLLCFISAVACAPLALFAQTAPTLPAKPALPALSPAQLNEGFKSGLISIVNEALVPTSIKVPAPALVAKAEADLAAKKKADTLKAFNAALADSVAKVAPQVADLIKKTLREMKIEDAKPLLAGGRDAGTHFLRKAVSASVQSTLLPAVKRVTASTDLANKGRAVLNAIEPLGVKGGNSMIVELDDYICNQVLAQSFKMIAAKEAAVRADPTLLKGNVLAQKVFALAGK